MGDNNALDQQDEEHTLIAQAQAGSKTAYGQLVLRYQRLVVSVAYHHGLDLPTAEDVAQETFIKAWLALARFKSSGGGLRAWLCRIAINVAIDIHRREQPTDELTEGIANGENSPAHQLEANDRIQIVRQALAQLPPASRAALILREYEGLSYAEIAEALDIPIGTVMSRLSYARNRLRELLVQENVD